jgi:hypothetical protein
MRDVEDILACKSLLASWYELYSFQITSLGEDTSGGVIDWAGRSGAYNCITVKGNIFQREEWKDFFLIC